MKLVEYSGCVYTRRSFAELSEILLGHPVGPHVAL